MGFCLTHRTKAQNFRGKFRIIFRKKIRSSTKICRAKFPLQTCHLKKTQLSGHLLVIQIASISKFLVTSLLCHVHRRLYMQCWRMAFREEKNTWLFDILSLDMTASKRSLLASRFENEETRGKPLGPKDLRGNGNFPYFSQTDL